MTVSPEGATTSEYLPPKFPTESNSDARELGQKMCVERHQSDYIIETCRHIVRCPTEERNTNPIEPPEIEGRLRGKVSSVTTHHTE